MSTDSYVGTTDVPHQELYRRFGRILFAEACIEEEASIKAEDLVWALFLKLWLSKSVNIYNLQIKSINFYVNQ